MRQNRKFCARVAVLTNILCEEVAEPAALTVPLTWMAAQTAQRYGGCSAQGPIRANEGAIGDAGRSRLVPRRFNYSKDGGIAVSNASKFSAQPPDLSCLLTAASVATDNGTQRTTPLGCAYGTGFRKRRRFRNTHA
jgi:hypothetical protein